MRLDFNAVLLADVHVLIPNGTESCTLVNLLLPARSTVGAGFDDRALESFAPSDLHALCRQRGIETVIVTLGARGYI